MLTDRQESFCRHIAEGETQAGAYAKAGYKTHNINVTRVNACRLLTKANVQLRVRELQREAAARSSVTVESLTKKLDAMYSLAEANSQPAAGVAAVAMIAKLHGLVVDRQDVRAEILRKPVSDPNAPLEMPFDDWSRKYGGKVIEH